MPSKGWPVSTDCRLPPPLGKTVCDGDLFSGGDAEDLFVVGKKADKVLFDLLFGATM